jgi:uncharacterized protein (UPF0210 family)
MADKPFSVRKDRMSVSYQDVSQACDTLTSNGNTISLRAIRHHIGYGSMTTISKFVTEWRKKNGAAGVSAKRKKGTSVTKKRVTVTPAKLVANSDDIVTGDTLIHLLPAVSIPM